MHAGGWGGIRVGGIRVGGIRAGRLGLAWLSWNEFCLCKTNGPTFSSRIFAAARKMLNI